MSDKPHEKGTVKTSEQQLRGTEVRAQDSDQEHPSVLVFNHLPNAKQEPRVGIYLSFVIEADHDDGTFTLALYVPEGIEGHRFELLACLSWVEEFWSNCEGGFGVVLDGNDSDKESEFLLPRALVDSVAACIHHLIASFDKFVKAHRRAHSLTGTNLPQAYLGRSLALSHWCFVSAHVALLSPPPPPPHSTQYESEWAALIAESTRSHRLRITEESVRSWYSGIVALRQDLNDIVQEFVDDSEVDLVNQTKRRYEAVGTGGNSHSQEMCYASTCAQSAVMQMSVVNSAWPSNDLLCENRTAKTKLEIYSTQQLLCSRVEDSHVCKRRDHCLYGNTTSLNRKLVRPNLATVTNWAISKGVELPTLHTMRHSAEDGSSQ
ncbi:hypothetical protein PDIDSM_1478 [Penicillium digitatum]|nr:hypothetical protein PDIDSM_1478 [Penicillium digitatum]